jgi:hypothetical protein
MKMECVQCDAEFTMSEQEIERYEEMGFDLPRRCPQCRKHKIRMSEDVPAGRKSRDKKKFYRIKYTDR